MQVVTDNCQQTTHAAYRRQRRPGAPSSSWWSCCLTSWRARTGTWTWACPPPWPPSPRWPRDRTTRDREAGGGQADRGSQLDHSQLRQSPQRVGEGRVLKVVVRLRDFVVRMMSFDCHKWDNIVNGCQQFISCQFRANTWVLFSTK